MKWQEYQEAVSVLYEQTEGFGNVRRNITIPDKITGQPRQIDTLIEIEAKRHSIKILVDAKFYSAPIDVKDVESVLALSESVGAHKAIIVAANGWTVPAAKKASFVGCDLSILSIDDALDLIVPDKWKMCPSCERDCIVMNQDGMVTLENGLILWWLAGQCRECKCARIHCQDCGLKAYFDIGKSIVCGCGHEWFSEEKSIAVAFFSKEVE